MLWCQVCWVSPFNLGETWGAYTPLWPSQTRPIGPVTPKEPPIQGVVLIQNGPWAGLYPSRGFDSGGLTSGGFHYRHGSHSADMLQVSSAFKSTRGRGHPCLIAVRPPTVGRVIEQRGFFGGGPLAPARVVCRPTRPLSPVVRLASVRGTLGAKPDEGGLKTHRYYRVGSEGVCGWLADGYHYPKTFGGQPKPISSGIPLDA